MNTLRIVFARSLVALLRYPWRLAEKMLGRRLPEKNHYLMLKVLRAFSKAYPVTLDRPNPIRPELTVRFGLDLCRNNQLWIFRRGTTYDAALVRKIAEGLAEADCFLDVGANVGVYSVSIAQAFPQKKVIAVEPLEENAGFLRRNAELNRLSNLTVVKKAVSDKPGRVSFYPNPLNDGGGSLIASPSYRTGDVIVEADRYRKSHPDFRASETVECTTLDDLIASKSVLKIDVEGVEMEALRSARRAFNRGLVRLLVVEVGEEELAGFINFMNGVGFDCLKEGQGSPLRPGDRLNRRYANVLCLPTVSRGKAQVSSSRFQVSS